MREADGWSYQAAAPVIHNGVTGASGKAQFGELLILNAEQKLAVTVCETGADNARIVDISSQSNVLIGRSSSCDISVDSAIVSGRHMELRRTASGWMAHDMGSANGTYLKGSRVKDVELSSGDSLDIGLCRVTLAGDSLTLSYAGAVNVNFARSIAAKGAAQPEDEYPHLFKRSPRLMEELPAGEIELETAPTIGGKPSISWASVLLMPIMSVLIILAVSFFGGGSAGMLVFSVPTTVLGVAMSIYSYKTSRKSMQKPNNCGCKSTRNISVTGNPKFRRSKTRNGGF